MKLVILDRDGVINYDSVYYIKSPEEWLPIPGSLEAIAQLTQAGYHVALATNQSGIARGLYSEQTLGLIHDKLHQEVMKLGGRVNLIQYCPHHPEENCLCRKPKPGLLLKIAEHYQLSLEGIPFVGDSGCDIEAGLTVGCKPFLVKTGNGPQTLINYADKIAKDQVSENLQDFVCKLLKK